VTDEWLADVSAGSDAALAARAGYVLRDNSAGPATKAGPGLYPHQWSWDAGFVAVGLATVDLPRAVVELESLFRGQWRTGMVPHIVFDPTGTDYFPGPDRWATAELNPDAPKQPRTSGICQPPIHAIAVAHILAAAERAGPRHTEWAMRWLDGFYPKLLAWHRWLVRERRDAATGLLEIFHGWESGLDNSPRWDEPYRRVRVGASLPGYVRRDTSHVSDAAQRPTDAEYDRYLWLVEEAKQARYQPERMRQLSSFRVGDVLFSAIFAAASDVLAGLAERLGLTGDAAESREDAHATRAAVLDRIDPATGLATDQDLRAGVELRTETIAGFAPLVAGMIPDDLRARQVALLVGPRWAGHPRLRWPLPPSTSPESAAFDARAYWRGPVWPVMNWLLAWALRRAGERAAAGQLGEAGIDQLRQGSFAEYYEPFTGEPLGGWHQSWTAAVALDWLR
jgi:glucosylglycerate hydrolase